MSDPTMVDLMTEQDGEFAAVMVEERPLGSDANQLAQLGEKFNAYVNFIVDGSFAAQVPAAAGRRIGIRFVCRDPLTAEVAAFLDYIARRLANHDVPLTVEVADYLNPQRRAE